MDETHPDPRAYIQIANMLRHRIADGTYRPGQPLPSLTVLQNELGHARQTISKAMRLLVREGLIYRPAGFEYYAGTDPVRRTHQPGKI
jgi:DNA-binding GntR family transcriptional regulator